MSQTKIRQLDATLVNQIAAGEVVERPASAMKELVENALDAGATSITVHIRDGGRTFLQVSDNGSGMVRDDLAMSIERHATSKLPDGQLFNIRTLGFRGEALPSIGSVARLSIQSYHTDEDHGWEINVEGGHVSAPSPCKHSVGTTVTVRDLFFATPARLKFLKSAQTEYATCAQTLRNLALAQPDVAWTFHNEERVSFDYPAQTQVERIAAVMGQAFVDNAWSLDVTTPQGNIKAWMSLPTFHRKQASDQFFFVNGRYVRNKILTTMLRLAYNDVLEPGRHPMGCIMLSLPLDTVDVNAHPGKTEVRFDNTQLLQSWLLQVWRQGLREHGNSTTVATTEHAVSTFRVEPTTFQLPPVHHSYANAPAPHMLRASYPSSLPTSAPIFKQPQQPALATLAMCEVPPLGYAQAQLFTTYIVSATDDALILVDQHAAHERIMYEGLKCQHQELARQALVIPVICMYPEASTFAEYDAAFMRLGLQCEWGHDRVILRGVPAMLASQGVDWESFLRDTLDHVKHHGHPDALQEWLNEKLASHACHNSVRAGRKMNVAEMNALLRQMESTTMTGQCQHGRPTYIKLTQNDLEKLFHRS